MWRDARTVQLGTDPRRAVVFEFARPRVARLLDLLDGTRCERRVLDDALAAGIPESDARQLLDVLCDARLAVPTESVLPSWLPEPARRRLGEEAAALALGRRRRLAQARLPPPGDSQPGDAQPAPAEVLRRRADARVLVTGASRLAGPIAQALATAGVGHVDPAITGRTDAYDVALLRLSPGDAGRPRSIAVAESLTRLAPGTDVSPLRGGGATFVVQAGTGRPANLAAAAYARRLLPHLVVAVRDATVVVGPLVEPAGSPCLHCLDLHRRDRDPAWPALVAQLSTSTPTCEPCALATTLAGVAYAVAEALAYIDGRPTRTHGATIEIDGPGDERRRTWPPHPTCDCARRPSRGASHKLYSASEGTMIG